jgi:hypothetical protein
MNPIVSAHPNRQIRRGVEVRRNSVVNSPMAILPEGSDGTRIGGAGALSSAASIGGHATRNGTPRRGNLQSRLRHAPHVVRHGYNAAAVSSPLDATASSEIIK